MFSKMLHIQLASLLVASGIVMGCFAEEDETSTENHSLITRLDEAFHALPCPPGLERESENGGESRLELARVESLRGKVDVVAAYRAAVNLHQLAECKNLPELKPEAELAYGAFRSRVAGNVLGASRARSLGDTERERRLLIELSEMVRPLLPDDAARADQRVRRIDVASVAAR